MHRVSVEQSNQSFPHCSFPAGDSKVYERVLDYNKIIEALALPKGLPDTNPYRSTACKSTCSSASNFEAFL